MKRAYEKPIVIKAQVRLQAVAAGKVTVVNGSGNDN